MDAFIEYTDFVHVYALFGIVLTERDVTSYYLMYMQAP